MKRSGWALGISARDLFSLAGWAQTDVISEIDVQGNRRIPAETVKARIFTHPGDIYDPPALERDFNALWNTVISRTSASPGNRLPRAGG